MNINYYEVLDIKIDATSDEIRSAYRKLSKHYHPDMNKASNAGLMFRLISEAHDILIDPSKRSTYDASINIKPSVNSATENASNNGPTSNTKNEYTSNSKEYSRTNYQSDYGYERPTDNDTKAQNNRNRVKTKKIKRLLFTAILFVWMIVLKVIYYPLNLVSELIGLGFIFLSVLFFIYDVFGFGSIIIQLITHDYTDTRNSILGFIITLLIGLALLYIGTKGIYKLLEYIYDLILTAKYKIRFNTDFNYKNRY